jgi:hypothetical protein
MNSKVLKRPITGRETLSATQADAHETDHSMSWCVMPEQLVQLQLETYR